MTTRDLPARRGRPRPPTTPKTSTRRKYSDQQRTAALDVYQRDGLAAAHRATGIPKGTLTGWARAAGVDTAAVTARSAEQTRRAADASVAARQQRLATLDEQAVDLLANLRVRALIATAAVLNGGKRSDTDPSIDPALSVAKPSDLVGIWTRATHDLQLLRGRPTEGVDSSGRVEVVFTAPRPTRRAVGSPPTGT